VAAAILRAAAEELALAALVTARLLALPDPVVSYSGSVFEAGALILVPFAACLARQAPSARVEPPFLPPVGGVLRLALAESRTAETGEALDRWRHELRGTA
jgi:hypothetical protein